MVLRMHLYLGVRCLGDVPDTMLTLRIPSPFWRNDP